MGLWNGLGLGKSSFLGGKSEQPVKPRIWRMGDAYEKKMPHHEGIKQLWESKWKFPVRTILDKWPVLTRIVLHQCVSIPRWENGGFRACLPRLDQGTN